ncbi:hypothetical protein GCWU000324_02462 [Kingella oralis ATCC 51147]|uniref:Uncharacterized protein n=1 Tax=Kingella oralis ATCC 51147 TaxID=629741 RepID=C4GK88_9NEIS|nr:hypothetical protein GCWU000324_02462 [Kingella oralis ATCC 51147]
MLNCRPHGRVIFQVFRLPWAGGKGLIKTPPVMKSLFQAA